MLALCACYLAPVAVSLPIPFNYFGTRRYVRKAKPFANRPHADTPVDKALLELRSALVNARLERTSWFGLGMRRLEVRIASRNSEIPLRWLKEQRDVPRCYFATPSASGAVIAGVGACDTIRGTGHLGRLVFQRAAHMPVGATYIGGARFAQTDMPSGEWQTFGGHSFVVPLISVEQDHDEVVVACHLAGRGATLMASRCAVLSALDVALAASPIREIVSEISFQISPSSPQQGAWSAIVTAALSRIHAGILEKVVVARRRFTFFKKTPKALDLLLALETPRNNDLCYRFALQIGDGGSAFFGCTPEVLFEVGSNGTVTIDSIAGTRGRSTMEETDNAMAAELLASRKDVLENALVASFVMHKVRRLAICGILRFGSIVDTIALLKLPFVMHLRCTLTAHVAHFRGPLYACTPLLDALHPTPAVLGLPADPAVKFLKTHEDFDRGLYSGPFGTIQRRSVIFSVAIRSALIIPERNTLLAYAGAGLVIGSDADTEWQEIDDKLRPIDAALERLLG